MKERNNFYVYLHIKEDTGEPFYVGKGKSTRYKSKSCRSKFWNRVVNKHGFDIIFLEIDLTNDEAYLKEAYWINRIGRRDLGKGPLVNHTDGGIGNNGKLLSEETKEKMKQAKLGKVLSEETKKKISLSNKGKTHKLLKPPKPHKQHKFKSEETKEKMLNNKFAVGNKGGKKNIGKKYKKESIKVLQYDLNKIFIKEWLNHNEAAHYYNTYGCHILKVCKNIKKKHKGFIWKFA